MKDTAINHVEGSHVFMMTFNILCGDFGFFAEDLGTIFHPSTLLHAHAAIHKDRCIQNSAEMHW